MKIKFKVVAGLFMASLSPKLLAPPAFAAPRVYEPKAGSAERKAIMDALRKPISKELKRKVIFQVHQLRVSNGWAWVMVTALRGDKSEPGSEDLWGNAQGLLHKKKGKWQVLVSGLATDVSILEAAKKYSAAPRIIFKDTGA